MPGRVILWIMGGAAVLLYARVGYFSFVTLGPSLGCGIGPELRFWGYGPEVFACCVDAVPPEIKAEYRAVLLGFDRLLSVAVAGFLMLWSLRLRLWIGVVAALAYGVSDWFENAYLVASLDGDVAAVGVASVLTASKFACLTMAIGGLFWAARQRRSDT